MNLNTRLHILGHVALKLAALAGALGGLLLITTIMLPPRAAQASSTTPVIAAGAYYTCALKGGQVYCWGANGNGQLGDGTTTDRTTPTLVADGAMGNSGVTAITASSAYHTCALKGGKVYCWGRNSYGQLGDGTDRKSVV